MSVRLIPVWLPDGQRVRSRSLASIERLLEANKVIVRRNGKGRIVAAQYRPHLEAEREFRLEELATRYSFWRRIEGKEVWNLKALPNWQFADSSASYEECQEQVRQMFSAVLDSIAISIG